MNNESIKNVKEVSEKTLVENVAFLKTNVAGEIASFQDCFSLDFPDGFKQGIASMINQLALLRGMCLNWLDDHDRLTVDMTDTEKG